MSWITDLFSGSVSKTIDSITDGVKKFITTDKDKMEYTLEVERAKLELQKLGQEAEYKRLEDIQSARLMFTNSDNSVQRTIAITFLYSYLALTLVLVFFIFGWAGWIKVDIPAWGVSLLSALWGAISSKMNTVIDFFFGSSKSSKDKDETVALVLSQNKPK